MPPKKYGTTVEKLTAYNHMESGAALQAGQEIKIPPQGYEIPSEPGKTEEESGNPETKPGGVDTEPGKVPADSEKTEEESKESVVFPGDSAAITETEKNAEPLLKMKEE